MRPDFDGDTSRVPLRRNRRTDGIALLEILVSILVLGVGTVAAIGGLSLANRSAAANRARIAALALCQERVDQVLADRFNPPGVMPSYLGTAWPVPASDTVTATEPVQIYADPNGTGSVTGTRTTLVSLGDATLNLVRITARVNYTYRGVNYVSEAFTLRSPD